MAHASDKILNRLIRKGKSFKEKHGLGYIEESTSSISGKTSFWRLMEMSAHLKTPPKTITACTFRYKYGHMQSQCYNKLLDRLGSQVSRLV